jgi:hypothetical protein
MRRRAAAASFMRIADYTMSNKMASSSTPFWPPCASEQEECGAVLCMIHSVPLWGATLFLHFVLLSPAACAALEGMS